MITHRIVSCQSDGPALPAGMHLRWLLPPTVAIVLGPGEAPEGGAALASPLEGRYVDRRSYPCTEGRIYRDLRQLCDDVRSL